MNRWTVGGRLIYGGAFGGVVSMLPEMFRKVNGYSLQFFGWGGEDDDMGDRYHTTNTHTHTHTHRQPVYQRTSWDFVPEMLGWA